MSGVRVRGVFLQGGRAFDSIRSYEAAVALPEGLLWPGLKVDVLRKLLDGSAEGRIKAAPERLVLVNALAALSCASAPGAEAGLAGAGEVAAFALGLLKDEVGGHTTSHISHHTASHITHTHLASHRITHYSSHICITPHHTLHISHHTSRITLHHTSHITYLTSHISYNTASHITHYTPRIAHLI